MNLEGKRVSILGAGRSGRAAAALALREGAEVHVFDVAEAIVGLPVDVVVHSGADRETGTAHKCDLLVVSPGIDTFGPMVAAFSKGAAEVIGEVELAYRNYHGRIIAITGTNGKTTTTELIERILTVAGKTIVACGNYGVPACEVVMRDPVPEVLALELSSFQLETIVDFRADVAVWLNFAADHMDRYPDELSYRRAKLRIFENQTESDTAVVRAGEGLLPMAARTVSFSTEDESSDWYSDGCLVKCRGELVMDLMSGSHIRGLHNAENAMAALAAGEALGVSREAMVAAFDGFAPPRHRCELVRTLDGVEWLNDSKATNLHALQSALRSQVRPVVLIVGGKEKGLDYRALLSFLEGRVVAAVTIGEISKALAGLLSEKVPVEMADSLEAAIEAARKQAPRGSSVLFSPGTSSFDQFTGYEQRGDVFCQLVHQLR